MDRPLAEPTPLNIKHCPNIAVPMCAVVLLAFTLPKAYELKKDDVDKVVALGQAKLGEVQKKLDETVFKKIPKAADVKKAE